MTSEQPMTLILGLGNVLMRDEAVGAEVVRRLERDLDQQVPWQFMDGGTLSFTLAGPIGDCERLVVVDAAALGEPPGTVRLLENEAMDRQLKAHAKSVHEVSLADLMDMTRLTGNLPRRRALVGIEPQEIDWGETLSPAVAAAVPLAMQQIRALIARWDAEDGASSAAG